MINMFLLLSEIFVFKWSLQYLIMIQICMVCSTIIGSYLSYVHTIPYAAGG